MEDGIIERYRTRQQEIIGRQQEIRGKLEQDCMMGFRWLEPWGRPIYFMSKSHPDCRYEHDGVRLIE